MIEVSVMTSGPSGALPVKWGRFPCGERNVKIMMQEGLPANMLYEQVSVRLVYESDSDLIDLMLLCDAIKRSWLEYKRFALVVDYFPYGRQDRVCSLGEAHSLKVVANLINSCGFDAVYVFDPHSDVVEALIDNVHIIPVDHIIHRAKDVEFTTVDAFVSPDGGAYKKVTKCGQVRGKNVVRADKIRNVSDGSLSGFGVYADDLTGQSVMIIDDICDGGGTFVGLAEKLREKGATEVILYVTHGMFTKGVDVLKEGIDKILCYRYYGPTEDKHKVQMIDTDWG